MGLGQSRLNIFDRIFIKFLQVKADGVFSQQPFGYKIAGFVRVGDQLSVKTDRQPAGESSMTSTMANNGLFFWFSCLARNE